jgi:hypothetical protein
MKNTIKKYISKLPIKRKKKEFGGFCANCENPLDGSFCSKCGQSAKDFHRPFFSVLSESLGDALSLDNKFIHTIAPLFLRPGFLTKEFMRGRRARYTPPFRLYLFLTFFAFLLLSHNHTPHSEEAKKLVVENKDGKKVDIFDFTNQSNNKQDSLASDSNRLVFNWSNFLEEDKAEVDSTKVSNEVFFESKKQLDVVKKMVNLWKINPALLIDNAFKKLSQTLLFILPIFALILALFYIRRKRYLIEHLLISLNFHSYIFVIVIVTELAFLTGIDWLINSMMFLYFLIPIQLFLTMKFYYQQSWIKTFFKFIFVSFLYNLTLIIGLFYSLIALVAES